METTGLFASLLIQIGKPRMQLENPHLLTQLFLYFPENATGLLALARDPDWETADAVRKSTPANAVVFLFSFKSSNEFGFLRKIKNPHKIVRIF